MTVPFATCRQALHASTYRHRVYLCHWRQLRTTISLARVGAPANSGSGVGGDCRVNLQACNRGPLMHALCGLSDDQAIITFLLPSIIRILDKLHSVSSVFAKWQCCMRAAWYFSGSSSALPLFHRTSHARNRRCGALARLLTAAAGSDHKAKNRGPPDPAQTILGGTPVSQHAQQRRPISGPRTGTLVL